MTEKKGTKKYLLTILIFAGFFLGILAGIFIGSPILPLAEVLSRIFLRLLNMAIMPLIITSIISAVLSIGNLSGLGRIGLKTFSYYIFSSFLAIMTGLVLVNVFKPGIGVDVGLQAGVKTITAANQSITELLVNIIPKNPFKSIVQGDVLPVIFFSVLLAVFITRLKNDPRNLMTNFFKAGFDTMLKMTMFIVWMAPLGVFGIVARITAKTGFSAFKPLMYYFLVVLLGLAIHAFVNLTILIYTLGRMNPVKHYRGMLPAIITGFSTCSTMVTLPLTMNAVTENSGVSKKIANFVLPIGATVNMDGTALYECVAVIFISQVYGVQLGLFGQFLVVITALLSSIGAASVPMSGMVMMSIILKAVGLPLEAVGIILAVDRILDMFRTTVNVLSDSCGAVIVARLEGESFPKQ